MSTIIELMLAIRKGHPVFYHKDMNQFDYWSFSQKERDNLNENTKLPCKDLNNFILPTYEEINHKEIMRFYVREFVEDKTIRKQLFDILRRDEYVDAYIEKLWELELYDDFTDVCGGIYVQIFEEWSDKNKLEFK